MGISNPPPLIGFSQLDEIRLAALTISRYCRDVLAGDAAKFDAVASRVKGRAVVASDKGTNHPTGASRPSKWKSLTPACFPQFSPRMDSFSGKFTLSVI
jgi:hypothetical protein